MRETLPAMAVFAAVVEEGGFSQGARRLGLSKSAASKQVARLEDRLGARLLVRTTRRVNTTEAGDRFYERCGPHHRHEPAQTPAGRGPGALHAGCDIRGRSALSLGAGSTRLAEHW